MVKAIVFDAYGTLYDVQSVAKLAEDAFPGFGNYITQVWRMKQLEYSWLVSLMGRYEDFWAITCRSLDYTLGTIGKQADQDLIRNMAEAYNRLAPYPHARECLDALRLFRRAILSNGSPSMLSILVENSGFSDCLDAVISVDSNRVYKPDPRAYQLVEDLLGVNPREVIFVSSNGFDIAGARSFGFQVVRIERVPRTTLQAELTGSGVLGVDAVFRALRTQEESLGLAADFTIRSLQDLPGLVAEL